jgi:hypothetical protein
LAKFAYASVEADAKCGVISHSPIARECDLIMYTLIVMATSTVMCMLGLRFFVFISGLMMKAYITAKKPAESV